MLSILQDNEDEPVTLGKRRAISLNYSLLSNVQNTLQCKNPKLLLKLIWKAVAKGNKIRLYDFAFYASPDLKQLLFFLDPCCIWQLKGQYPSYHPLLLCSKALEDSRGVHFPLKDPSKSISGDEVPIIIYYYKQAKR